MPVPLALAEGAEGVLQDEGTGADTEGGADREAPGYDAGAAVTDGDGVARWEGWFVPGAWTFGTDGRPLLEAEHDLEPARLEAEEDRAWRLDLEPEPQPEPQPQSGPGAGGGPTGTTGTPGGTGTSVGAARVAPGAGTEDAAQQQTPVPAGPSGGPSRGSGTNGGGSTAVADPADEPARAELETAAGVEPLMAGVVLGIGVLFLGVVGFGFVWLRRRAGRQA